MNKNQKIIVGISIFIALLIIGYFAAPYFFWKSVHKKTKAKEPKIEVPITYNVGWCHIKTC